MNAVMAKLRHIESMISSEWDTHTLSTSWGSVRDSGYIIAKAAIEPASMRRQMLRLPQPSATQKDADDEQKQRLRHAPVLYRPEEIAWQSVAYAYGGHIQRRAVGLCGDHCGEVCARAEIERLCGGVGQTHDYICQLDGLQQQYRRDARKQLVACPYRRQDDQTADGIYEEYVAVVEAQVEQAEDHQQYHAPYESRPEVVPPLRLIVVLDIETQTEQKREYRIHLAGQQEEYRIPYGTVDGRRFGKYVEVHVLDEVYQYYSAYGYAAQNVRYVDSCIRFERGRVAFHDNGFCFSRQR